MSIVTIHQPEHMPWSGYFHKMAQADIYVLLDNVQFKKNNWQNRNRIITRTGDEQWLTVPVKLKGHIGTTIRDMEISEQEDWRRKYWGRIVDSYYKHPYFKPYSEILFEIIHRRHTRLCDLNRDLIDFFRKILQIENRLVWASELTVTGKSTELLISILKSVGGDTYISGPDGAKYMDMEMFKSENIKVTFHHYSPPTYSFLNGYLAGLSTLDIVMNHGENAAPIIGIGNQK